jgi:endo-1,3(4)-beta-glucanase
MTQLSDTAEAAPPRSTVRRRTLVRIRSLTAIVFIVGVTLLVQGCSVPTASRQQPQQPYVLPDSVVAPLVKVIPHRTVTALPTARLAKGLTPPTNRWFSGLVYGASPAPVFPLPLSFGLTPNGFQFGVPTVSSSASAVVGPLSSAVIVDVGATSQEVSRYDAASVTIQQTKGPTVVGPTIIAEGSPFVTYSAVHATTIALGKPFLASSNGVFTRLVNGTTYGFVTTGKVGSGTGKVTLSGGQLITWFAVAQGSTVAKFAAAARAPLVGTNVTYSVSGTRSTTTVYYQTASGAPTLFAAMRHQYGAPYPPKDCAAAGYPSIFGQLRLCSGISLTWSVPTLQATSALPLQSITPAQKSDLAVRVAADAANPGPMPHDIYFAGKYLYRLANLFTVAQQVGATAASTLLKADLVSDLNKWTDPRGCLVRSVQCFVYDPSGKGIIGLAPAFGSDVYNDHHFDYGYFLYAAGAVAANDPALARKWAPILNLLAADVGTGGPSTYFPQQRVFDSYAGHSWAGGTGISNVGNNEESSSEAVTAWNGLALWAKAANQPALLTEATWMLSTEASSADAYWTNFPLGTAAVEGYKHSVVSQVWGAQRVYSTFFSNANSAKLAIVLLPMSPVAGYLGGDQSRIRLNLRGAAPSGFDVPFGDQLLMYSALESKQAAAAGIATARALPASSIDGGDSRTYLLAWMMAHSTN